MSEYLMEIIGYQVESTADWRREKAQQFPDDDRNPRAAKELDELASGIGQIFESDPVYAQVVEQHETLIGLGMDAASWAVERLNEDVAAELRSIGFHGGYESAHSFLEWYSERLQEAVDEALNEAVPIPDLNDQIANDPAVRAAKRAYDEAVAKAYAEARKKL
jgi:hypothetical protein